MFRIMEVIAELIVCLTIESLRCGSKVQAKVFTQETIGLSGVLTLCILHHLMKTSSIAVETSRFTSKWLNRETNDKTQLSFQTTMTNTFHNCGDIQLVWFTERVFGFLFWDRVSWPQQRRHHQQTPELLWTSLWKRGVVQSFLDETQFCLHMNEN